MTLEENIKLEGDEWEDDAGVPGEEEELPSEDEDLDDDEKPDDDLSEDE
ncbi:MAG: hypothetical protein WC410_02705 [Candidatus Paceibacterota bacterium]|jgi:hypothetical protein|nr:hypothetical protein [Candidatus Paceibacterota bacterium]MDD5555516.1 hypothetical protein [Candidatus Paceibacterota bacterium]